MFEWFKKKEKEPSADIVKLERRIVELEAASSHHQRIAEMRYQQMMDTEEKAERVLVILLAVLKEHGELQIPVSTLQSISRNTVLEEFTSVDTKTVTIRIREGGESGE